MPDLTNKDHCLYMHTVSPAFWVLSWFWSYLGYEVYMEHEKPLDLSLSRSFSVLQKTAQKPVYMHQHTEACTEYSVPDLSFQGYDSGYFLLMLHT